MNATPDLVTNGLASDTHREGLASAGSGKTAVNPREAIMEVPSPSGASTNCITNGPGMANGWFRALVEFERDSLPELPAPRDYAEYERARREQAGCDLYTPLEYTR